MGAFIVNFHVRAKSIAQVSKSLRQIPIEDAWIAGPPDKPGKWISFWERLASDQNTDRIQQIAEHVSRSLKSPLIAFLVHDSDVLCYWLYELGAKIDEYNSCPSYWGDEAIDATSLKGNCELLAKHCVSRTDASQLKGLLTQRTQADRANGVLPEFIFAEQRLAQLAPLLGLREDRLMADYNDFGRDVRPEEVGATRIRAGKQRRNVSDADDVDETNSFPQMPSAPLLEAAVRGDLAAIEKLIADGADINEIPHGYTVTPLGMAATEASPATLRKLVSLGADIQKKGREGATPLRLAIQSNQIENIRTLVELGADLDEYDAKLGTLLHVAVLQSSFDAVPVLLELGLDPDRPNAHGVTPLHGVQVKLKAVQQATSLLKGAMIPPVIVDHIRRLEDLERILLPSRK